MGFGKLPVPWCGKLAPHQKPGAEARGAQCSTYKEACWPALAMAEEADE